MSHFSTLQTKLVSGRHLVQALADLGLTQVEVSAEPQAMVGWMTTNVQHAHIIVRRAHLPGAQYDLGFHKNAEGSFDALVANEDRESYGYAWLGRLTQRYAYHVSRELLKKQGFTQAQEKREADGTIRLTLRRMA
jgi:hypothetical protein